jgi:acyl carrier protein
MNAMERTDVVELIQSILRRQGREIPDLTESASLSEIAFRSLDFSELCLRVEQRIGRELSFGAATVRNVSTVADVCDFIAQAST